MALLQRLEMRQGQSLVMTPQLLQAIKLLQLSHLDLVSYVEAELERNPFLETPGGEDEPRLSGERDLTVGEAAEFGESGFDDAMPDRLSRGEIDDRASGPLENVFPDDSHPAPDTPFEALPLIGQSWSTAAGGSFDGEDFDHTASLTSEPSLQEHLSAQLHLATADPAERFIGGYLIDAVEPSGYMTEPLGAIAERLGVPQARVEACLALLQTFSPSGICGRNLAECLTIQLRERDRFDPAMQALIGRLDLVARHDLAALRRICGVDEEDLADMLRELRELDPKPGRAFGAGPVHVLVPDVFVRAAPDGSWLVELNPDTLPRVLVNQAYHATVTRHAQGESERSFISECLQSANWLTRSLEQRSKTILKVATEIVRQQDGFFVNGVAHLRPLNLKTVADAIGMHESTVSRVTSNKSIGTSRGTFEMKYFFTASIPGAGGADAHSSEAVRHRIRQLVEAERAEDVLSDDALVKRLRGEGIEIARRTVAKYRESLRIPSSVDRRRDKMRAAR